MSRKGIPLTKKEYDLLIEAGYQLEPYEELCIVKAGDMFYREEIEEMLKTARQILRERKYPSRTIIPEEQRDRAQSECWSKTFKATKELFPDKSDIWITRYLLDMPKERLMVRFRLYAPEWAEELELYGGIK